MRLGGAFDRAEDADVGARGGLQDIQSAPTTGEARRARQGTSAPAQNRPNVTAPLADAPTAPAPIPFFTPVRSRSSVERQRP